MPMKHGSRPKVPTATRQRGGTAFTLNARALELLTQDGESYVAVARGSDGSITIQPIPIPRGALTVLRVVTPPSGATRLNVSDCFASDYKPGARYRCQWDDVATRLVVTFEEV